MASLLGARFLVGGARAPRPVPLPVVLLSGPLVVSWSRSLVVISRPLPPVRAHRHPVARLTSIVKAGARRATPRGRRLQTLRACRS